MTVGNCSTRFKKVGGKVFRHEGERDDAVGDAKRAALVGGAREFSRIVFRAVVEAESGDHFLRGGHMMKSGDRIKATGEKNNDFHGKNGL